jgi:hypothetical protein
MKINKEYKKKFFDTYDMWCWLAETGKEKRDYYYFWNKIYIMRSHCGFCDYMKENKLNCSSCPLVYKTPVIACMNGLFNSWANAKYESKEKKEYAKLIKDRIEKFLTEEGILKCK